MGCGLWKVKRAPTTVVFSEYDFNLYKGFLMEKNAPSLWGFEGIFFKSPDFYE
jgi:hypothetical protein